LCVNNQSGLLAIAQRSMGDGCGVPNKLKA